VVDHVRPHRGEWALFADFDNTQSLCASHHSASKQRDEHRGFVGGCDANGEPLDPHPSWRRG
jgi:hypothetical protein